MTTVRHDRKRMEKFDHHPSLLLDVVALGIAIALLGLALRFGPEVGRPAMKGSAAVIGGVYLLYLGALFLLSYFFPRRCFLFRFLDRVCREHSYPRGRGMALFYFALALLFGTSLLLVGFGIL